MSTEHPAAEFLLATMGFTSGQLKHLMEICDAAVDLYNQEADPQWAECAAHYREMFAKRVVELEAQMKAPTP